MSGFICGELAFASTDALHDGKILADIVAQGAAKRLFFHFAINIQPDIVFEILGLERSFVETKRVPFLVTDSALSPTSHELIYPESYSPDDLKRHAHEALDQLGAVLRDALDTQEVLHAIVVISEGFSPTFTELSCTPERLGETCVAHFEDLGPVPLRVLVRRV